MTWKETEKALKQVAQEDPEAVYRSFCNVAWVPVESEYQDIDSLPPPWHDEIGVFISWREAGAMVARILDEGDYLDWYCSGREGEVDPRVAAVMLELGLRPVT